MMPLFNFDLKYFNHRRHPQKWRLDPHEFHLHGVLLVLDGEVEYTLNGQTYTLTAGSLLYSPPGSMRQTSFASRIELAVFDFESTQQLAWPPVQQTKITDTIRNQLREMEFHWLQDSRYDRQRCHLIFLNLMTQLTETPDTVKANRHVEWMKRYIVSHYTERIEVAQLAEILGLSPFYCGSLFHEVTGLTIKEYLNQIRINKSCALLSERHDSIAEIAELCGFSNVYYFSKVFKKQLGKPPGQYRKEMGTVT